MKIANFIRYLYGVIDITFYYILLLIFLSPIKGLKISYEFYFITVIGILIFVICNKLCLKVKVIYFMEFITFVILIFSFYAFDDKLIYCLFSLPVTLTMIKANNMTISRYTYYSKLKLIFISLIILLIAIIFINNYTKDVLKNFYVLEFLLSILLLILLLILSRNIEFNVDLKKSKKDIVIIVSLFLIFLSNPIINFIIRFIQFLYAKLVILLDLLIDIMCYVFNFIESFLYMIIKNPSKQMPDYKTETFSKFNEIHKLQNKHIVIYYFEKILKIMVLIFLIILVIYVVKKIINRNLYKIHDENGSEEIIREKICKNYTKNKKIKFFNKPTNKKDCIIFYFGKLQNKFYKNGALKKHMTSTEFLQSQKKHFINFYELEQITTIYNEVKFSNHEIEQKEFNDFKNAYKNLYKK